MPKLIPFHTSMPLLFHSSEPQTRHIVEHPERPRPGQGHAAMRAKLRIHHPPLTSLQAMPLQDANGLVPVLEEPDAAAAAEARSPLLVEDRTDD